MGNTFYKKSKVLASLILALLVTGCDSNDSDTSQTGVFVDSPVANIDYRTFNQRGVTNEAGEFVYQPYDAIIFSIGDIDFPRVRAGSLVTPLDIANSDDTSDPVVLNIARLLLSLDLDGDPDNGIWIGDQAKIAAMGMTVDFSAGDFEAMVAELVANSGSVTTTLVSAAYAQSHLEQTLADLDEAYCSSDVSDEDKTVYGCFNTAPVAVITYDGATTVAPNTDLIFDGSNSYDPDGDAITYSWRLASVPEGSIARLLTPTEMNTEIRAMDLEGDYIIELTVRDGFDENVTTINITAEKSLPAASSMFGFGLGGLMLLSLLASRRGELSGC